MFHCSISAGLGLHFSYSCTLISTCTYPLPFNPTNSSLYIPCYRATITTWDLKRTNSCSYSSNSSDTVHCLLYHPMERAVNIHSLYHSQLHVQKTLFSLQIITYNHSITLIVKDIVLDSNLAEKV